MLNKTTTESKINPQLNDSTPVRLCCGQKHWGIVCPDGKVMCCLCLKRVSQDELHILPNGEKEDVCETCYEKEMSILKRNKMKLRMEKRL